MRIRPCSPYEGLTSPKAGRPLDPLIATQAINSRIQVRPSWTEQRNEKRTHHSLKSPLCSCVWITLPASIVNPDDAPVTIIEIRPFRNGWQVYETPPIRTRPV